jgi:hypothetical protein
MNEKTLVVVSDPHVGSLSAVAPKQFKRQTGGRLGLNRVQDGLRENWDDMVSRWKNPDILVVCGDAIEGKARKDSGVPTWTTNFIEQLDGAKALLDQFNAKKVYVIIGTGYHVDSDGVALEEMLAQRMKAEKIPQDGEALADQELFIQVHSTIFHFAHHISVASGWWRTTPIARELVFALLSEHHKLPKGKKVDVFCRGHCHYFCGVEFSRQHGYILPCWQVQTRYLYKKSAFGTLPSIGALRFRIGPDGWAKDKLMYEPVPVKPKLFVFQ